MKIIIRNRAVIVYSKKYFKELTLFSNKFTTYTDPITREIDKMFVPGNRLNFEFIFNITILPSLLLFIRTIVGELSKVEMINSKTLDFDNVEFIINNSKTYRDEQESIVNMLSDGEKSYLKLLDLRTGFGKGLVSLRSVANLGKRTAIVALSKYITKTYDEILTELHIEPEDVFIAQGHSGMNELMSMSRDELPKIILFPMRTLGMYFDNYEAVDEFNGVEFTYRYTPLELFEKLSIGTLSIEEVHREFYNVNRAICYFNAGYIMALSATLKTKDKRVEGLHKTVFPMADRISFQAYNKYVNFVLFSYNFHNKYMQHRIGSMYSHNTLEKSIFRVKQTGVAYMEMILYAAAKYYKTHRKPGGKLLIFMSLIRSCERVKHHIEHSEQFKGFTVSKYTSGDPKSNLYDYDIVVTTNGSAGENMDVKGLITVIQTVNMDTPTGNNQAWGRLRKPLDEEQEVHYVSLWSKDIKKHQQYNRYLIEAFSPKAKGNITDVYRNNV